MALEGEEDQTILEQPVQKQLPHDFGPCGGHLEVAADAVWDLPAFVASR